MAVAVAVAVTVAVAEGAVGSAEALAILDKWSEGKWRG